VVLVATGMTAVTAEVLLKVVVVVGVIPAEATVTSARNWPCCADPAV
jgi:hypothetical protein